MLKKYVIAAAFAAGLAGAAHAVIPVYGSPGTINAATYTFTATGTGPITAYFAGNTAAFTSEIGLSINGGAVAFYGLNNQSSALGQSLVLGNVNVGDTLRFVLNVITTGDVFSSDASLNPGGQQHVYATAYAGGDFGIPAGTYIGFEDLPDLGDRDYDDHQFVFTGVRGGGVVPEPATWAMLIAGFGMVGFAARRRRTTAVAA